MQLQISYILYLRLYTRITLSTFISCFTFFFFKDIFLLSSIFLYFMRTSLLASSLSSSSNIQSKLKLLLIGCLRCCWVPSNPINASLSRVKRCALPYEKEATVNLGERLSRAPEKRAPNDGS